MTNEQYNAIMLKLEEINLNTKGSGGFPKGMSYTPVVPEPPPPTKIQNALRPTNGVYPSGANPDNNFEPFYSEEEAKAVYANHKWEWPF
jgi:hypothetical protein